MMKMADSVKEKAKVVVRQRWWPKWVGVGMIFVMLVILASLAYTSWYLVKFSQASGLPGREIGQIAKQSVARMRQSGMGRVNLLLLGADEEKRDGGGILTDAIMLASLNLDEGKVTMISIPRDLWDKDWKTKINAIYYYGEKTAGKTGANFATSEIEKITGVKSDYYILVRFETLRDVVDALGGVGIDVPNSFTDEKFPIPAAEVDRSVPTPKIYETIRFDRGLQMMNGELALKYVRSRQTENKEESGDIARERRQQQVISAIVARLNRPEVWVDPEMVGRLYKVWKERVKTNLSEPVAVGVGYGLWQKGLVLSNVVLPTEGEGAILVSPSIKKYGQWVFEPKGGNWDIVREYIGKNL